MTTTTMYCRKICIVLPTYNESANIKTFLSALFEQTENIEQHDIRVLVVDDQSPDGTAEQVRKLMRKYPRLYLISGRKKGLGAAYKRGFAYAMERFNPEYLIQMDADWQHSPESIPDLIALCTKGYDVVIGSRFVSGAATPGFPWRRRLMSRVGNVIFRIFSGIHRIQDVTSGFRCIRAGYLRECRLEDIAMRGYAFQSVLLYRLMRCGALVAEVPIIFPNRKCGKSKLAIRDKLEFIIGMIGLRSF